MQEKDMNKMKKRTFIIQEVNSNVQKKTKIMRSRFTRCVRLAIFIFEISIISQKQETKKKKQKTGPFSNFFSHFTNIASTYELEEEEEEEANNEKNRPKKKQKKEKKKNFSQAEQS